jgi:Photosystem II reaction centre W protein (PsbW)
VKKAVRQPHQLHTQWVVCQGWHVIVTELSAIASAAFLSELWPSETTRGCCVQVDERMNGEGAGIPLGVNEPILGFVMLGVFTTVWILYALTAKSFGGQDEEDGLSL